MAKTTMVELECKTLGRRLFSIEQATAILTNRYNKPSNGWYLPEDSEYEFVDNIIVKKQKNNDIEYKRHKRSFVG
jgi:hypothetical protein